MREWKAVMRDLKYERDRLVGLLAARANRQHIDYLLGELRAIEHIYSYFKVREE